MYREKIRESYDHLSRSYRRVADFIMGNYYEVSFMTAAQLAHAVGVDTTTVVRFSQRLSYNGYPALLADIRAQVRAEIYAAYEPVELAPEDPAAVFKGRVEQEQHNLNQMLVHNPPERVREVAAILKDAARIVLVAEGYAGVAATMAAQQLRHRGIGAEAADQDIVIRSATLMGLDEGDLVIGVSATQYGTEVARALEYARQQGCATLGIVGSLASPVNRVSDCVVYAPTDATGPLPSVVALVAALAALVQIASQDNPESIENHLSAFQHAYSFLLQSDNTTST
jgi:DNA-binding MurR/RpiR family transcriptional regulator